MFGGTCTENVQRPTRDMRGTSLRDSSVFEPADPEQVMLGRNLSLSVVSLWAIWATMAACTNRTPSEQSQKRPGSARLAAPATPMTAVSGARQEQPAAAASVAPAPRCQSDAECAPPTRCVAITLPSPHIVPLDPDQMHLCKVPCRESKECPNDQVCNCDGTHQSSEGVPCHYCFCAKCEQADMVEFAGSLERARHRAGGVPNTVGSE